MLNEKLKVVTTADAGGLTFDIGQNHVQKSSDHYVFQYNGFNWLVYEKTQSTPEVYEQLLYSRYNDEFNLKNMIN